jgi:hypothetical protein
VRVVSLGLGSFTATRASLYQCAGLLLLRELLATLHAPTRSVSVVPWHEASSGPWYSAWKEDVRQKVATRPASAGGVDIVFDPLFSDVERALLRSWGFQVAARDPWGKRHVAPSVEAKLAEHAAESGVEGGDVDWSGVRIWGSGECVLYAPHAPVELIGHVAATGSSGHALMVTNSPTMWMDTLSESARNDLRKTRDGGRGAAESQAPDFARAISRTLRSDPGVRLAEVHVGCDFGAISRLAMGEIALDEPRSCPEDGSGATLPKGLQSAAESEALLLAFSATSVVVFSLQ